MANRKKYSDIKTVAFVSLGCPKNLVDSEKMLGLLAEDGLVPTADHARADAIVVNTCGFLEASKDESMEVIAEAAARKKKGSCQRLIVAGCLVQRHRAKMLEWCPDIDALIGVFDRDRIVEAVRGTPRGSGGSGDSSEASGGVPVYSSIAATAAIAKRRRHITDAGYFESDAARLRLTPRHYAYLRISEGCNQNCAFCTIPSIRGKMRSKPVEAILAEARELLADGAFELNLIGQDTTSYGQDIGYAPGLAGMLGELDRATRGSGGGAGTVWLRLMYAYPSCFTDPMIDAIAELPGVLKYIDMPLQHINDRVLNAMRRRTSRKLIETLLAKLRRVPGMAIRTTFISGFPGETDAEHRELVKFVRDVSEASGASGGSGDSGGSGGFEAMGVFPYSPEPGTPAGTLHASGQAVPPQAIKERIDELMLAQQEVVFARHAELARQGPEIDVLIDAATATRGKATTGVSARNSQLYVGRTYRQAPQIDGVTYVQSRDKLAPGELVRCRITDSDGYDLIARPLVDLQNKRSLPVITRR